MLLWVEIPIQSVTVDSKKTQNRLVPVPFSIFLGQAASLWHILQHVLGKTGNFVQQKCACNGIPHHYVSDQSDGYCSLLQHLLGKVIACAAICTLPPETNN